MQEPVLFVSKVLGEVFPHFHVVAVKRHRSMQKLLFGLPGRIFVFKALGAEESVEHFLDFFFAYLTFFGLDEFGLSVYSSCCLPPTFV
jgi:hypothetical protein